MDIAVSGPASDRLGRWEFAKSLASQIWDLPPSQEGFVISLEAEWGAGKSSVINMTLYRLLLLELVGLSDTAWFHGEEEIPIGMEEMEGLTADYDAIVGFGQPGFDLNYVHPDHYIDAATTGSISRSSIGISVCECGPRSSLKIS